MSKLEKRGKFRPFRPLISAILGKVHAKIEKKLLNSFYLRQTKGNGAFLMPIRPSSVVVVNFSLKILIYQKLPDNFFLFWYIASLGRRPMYCINIDLIE